MSLLPEIRDELFAAADRRGRGAERAPRQRRWRDSVSTAIAIALVVVVVGAVGAVLLSVHRGPGDRSVLGPNSRGGSGATAQAFRLLMVANRHVLASDPACRPRRSHAPLLSYGSPPRTITAVLGVFRRPAPAGQQMSPRQVRILSGQGSGVYVRFARTGKIDGVRYYLLPQSNRFGDQPVPRRCYRERLKELRKLAERLPAPRRHRAIDEGARIMGIQQAVMGSPDGVQLITMYGPDSAHSFLSIPAIRIHLADTGSDGGALPGHRQFTITPLVVADGVATVTATYPAENQPGHVSHQVITRRVRSNVVIFRVMGGWDPPSLTYRSASGAVLWSTPKH